MLTTPQSRRQTASACRRYLALALVASLILTLALPRQLVLAQITERLPTPSVLKKQTSKRDAPLPSAASFASGNLVIYRAGDGSAALNATATAIFLDEYTPAGMLVQSIPMPTAVSGANKRLTGAGSSTTEGLLTRSADGRFITLGGYDAAVGTAAIAGTTAATVNRVVGRVDAAGTVDTTTALTNAFNTGNIRSVVSSDGTTIWMSGSNEGVRTTTLGSTTSTVVSSTQTNLRQINIFNGQLYVSSGAGTNTTRGVNKVGTGLPTTTGNTTTRLAGFTDTTAPASNAFVILNDPNNAVSGDDTIYVADDTTSGTEGGLQKWTSTDGVNWTKQYRALSGTAAFRGVTGQYAGSTLSLFATTTDNKLVSVTDTGSTLTFTTLATAATNTAFRGVAFAPIAAGPTNPSGTGAANPSTVTAGNSTLLTVTVTPGANPTSTGITVTGDLSSIGGSATQQFFDNMTNGDVTAGDNIFSFNATVDANTTPGVKSLPVTINDAQARMGSTSISLTVQSPAGACGDTFTPIYTIQGSGTASPIIGSTVSTEGVVVGDFQGSTNLSGFYIQDPSGDANTATSDGIYVFDGSTPAVNVAAGDRVRVGGTVAETFGNTRINPSSVQICSTGNTLPAATVYDLPEPVDGDLERVENMLVTFPETLTVTGNFTWGRFGELVLSADGRLYQQNSFDRPNTAGALARADLNARAYVFLDDGQSVQNPNPIPYQSPNMTRRAGDTVTGLTGVLTFDFNEYRIQPTGPVTFAQANPRPAAPASVGGNLKVASSNVLNYFNGDGMGSGFPTSRGASNAAEFARQRAKVIAALTALNADVIGVSEMENDGFGPQSALQDLINGMNDATAPGTYAGIDSPNPGTDLIKNAIIYKPASVALVGPQVNDINSAWDQARPPLAQVFQHNGNGEKFTFIVNHFTSKGCSMSDTGIDADMGDGQGCDNGQRKIQADRLLVFIQDRKTASGDPDVLSMGDYNAYGEEDPLFNMEQDVSDTLMDGAGGLISQSKRFVPMLDRYSFQFQSRFGELDHAFATKSLNSQVSGTTIWHINADEPVAIDYNTEFKTQDLFTPTAFRASDHDPLIVGLNLTSVPPQPAGSLIISEFRFRGPGPSVVNRPASGSKLGPLVSTSGGVNINVSTPQSEDEFVELYNNTDSDITVSTTDGSAGWTVVASTGNELFRIDNNTVIPARGHYLGTNAGGYSLNDYGGTSAASGNTAWIGADIPDGGGVAVFRTNNPVNYTLDERLDAAGYTTAPELYREGAGFPTGGNETISNLQYSFLRSMTRTTNGLPKDTGNNAADFIAVSTDGMSTGQGRNLGAPGPENLSSPITRNTQFAAALLDPNASSSAQPNRVRDPTPDMANNSPSGTMSIRRTFTNNTGFPVTRLRFRIVEVTTFTSPPVSGQADLRARSSNDIIVMVGGNSVDVRGTTVETPPAQPGGGGWNSSMTVGFVTTDVPLADGDSVSVQFLLGVMQTGKFSFFVNIEAVTDTTPVAAPSRWPAVRR